MFPTAYIYTRTMGHYSSSPGAIYPALRRLEERGLASSWLGSSATMRPKRIDDLMLRFAFMGALVTACHRHGFAAMLALPNPLMPDAVRHAHLVETVVSRGAVWFPGGLAPALPVTGLF